MSIAHTPRDAINKAATPGGQRGGGWRGHNMKLKINWDGEGTQVFLDSSGNRVFFRDGRKFQEKYPTISLETVREGAPTGNDGRYIEFPTIRAAEEYATSHLTEIK